MPDGGQVGAPTGAGDVLSPDVDVQCNLQGIESQIVLYARDLKRVVDTERRRARELAEANSRLEILDRLKTDFLVFISHSLRTPLHALSLLDWVDPQAIPEEYREELEILRRGYLHLDEFIRKGLEYFSWLAEGKVDATSKADLVETVQAVANSIPALREPHAFFRLSTPTGTLMVQISEVHLSEVVRTLLQNALKFSPREKHIVLSLEEVDEKLRLVVADRGVGLPPRMITEIFEPFTIADTNHHGQGTGLSLALSRAIVETHGGAIWAESEGLERGTRFIVEFPKNPSSEQVP